MKIEDEIKINQFGQDIFNNEYMVDIFENFNIEDKRKYIEDIIFLILQSKSGIDDIDKSIELSELKATFTPCVMLRKGVNQDNLFNISRLPDNELKKSFLLLINFFKVGYKRRYKNEKNNPDKWWYWDLSNKKNIDIINGASTDC